MQRTLWIVVLVGAVAATAAAAGPGIITGQPVRVSADRPDVPWVEPHLAAHPDDPRLLFGAALTLAPDRRSPQLVSHFFRSSDGGRSWRRSALSGCLADPWVEVAPDGTVFVSCHELHDDGRTGVRVLRSTDLGETWLAASVPAGAGGSVDQPKLVVDRSPGPRRGHLYLAFGQNHRAPVTGDSIYGPAISMSEDGGATFSPPIFFQHDVLSQQPVAAVVLGDDSLQIAFMDFATPEPRLLTHRRSWLVSSADGGRTVSLPWLIQEQVDHGLVWAMTSGAVSGSRERMFVAVDGHWTREGTPPPATATLPALAIRSSDDRGRSWSPPVPVSSAAATANAEIPALALSKQGVLAVAWYDTRHDEAEGRCFDVYATASCDGGRSFLPEIRLTETSSCPDPATMGFVANRFRFGGDYSGLAADAGGLFHALWADTRMGVYQLWSARIEAVCE